MAAETANKPTDYPQINEISLFYEDDIEAAILIQDFVSEVMELWEKRLAEEADNDDEKKVDWTVEEKVAEALDELFALEKDLYQIRINEGTSRKSKTLEFHIERSLNSERDKTRNIKPRPKIRRGTPVQESETPFRDQFTKTREDLINWKIM